MKKKHFMAAVVLGVCVLAAAGCGKGKKSSGEAVSDTEAAELEALDYNTKDYVRLGEYKKLKVKYPVPTVSDEDVQMTVDELVEENLEYTEITDRGAQESDSVNIDFTGTVDGEEFDGGSEEDYDLVLGEGEFLEEFENNLIGKKAGEVAEFSVEFPEDYSEEMAGKTAEFKVTVNSVSEVKRPEYNDAFVAEVTDYDTVEAYEESVREDLMASAAEESKQAAGEDALSQAIENAKIDGYPQALYDVCYADTEESYRAYAEMFGMEFEDFMSEFMGGEDLGDTTLSWVNEIMVSQAIAEKEGFAISDETYETEGASLATEYGYASLEEFEADYGKVSVITNLLREKTIDFLYENSEVEEVSQEEYYGDDEEIEVDNTEADGDTEEFLLEGTE